MQNSLLSFISSLIINKDEQKLLDDQHKATQVFKNITKNFSLTKALKASQADRECLNLTSNSYKYGEIDFNSLHQALVVAKPAEGGIFYDLGSGIGKGVIAASLLHKFNICKGIEQLGTLFELSQELGINFKQQENSVKQEMLSLDIDWELPQIEFIHSDFLKYDWSDGTFIYASTTCYDAGLMRNISKKAKELKSGAIFVTLTKQLEPTDEWKLIDKIRVNVSWGASTMYVQRKI